MRGDVVGVCAALTDVTKATLFHFTLRDKTKIYYGYFGFLQLIYFTALMQIFHFVFNFSPAPAFLPPHRTRGLIKYRMAFVLELQYRSVLPFIDVKKKKILQFKKFDFFFPPP